MVALSGGTVSPDGTAAVDVLVVDDSAGDLCALQAVLDGPGLNLFTAQSGAEAQAIAAAREMALIILDVQMPGMDGFETARQVRSAGPSSRAPIIFLTALEADTDRVRQAYASGAVDFVVKPFDPEILRAKMAVFVDLFRKTREIAAQARREWEAAEKRAHIERERDAAAALARELRRIDQLKDEFLATLAHELRNPLTPLMAACTVLDREPIADPTLARLMAMIGRQVRTLSRLVEDALDISRFTRRKIDIRKEPAWLGDVVAHAVEMSRALVDGRQHHLEIRLPPDPIGLYADPVRIAQVIANLLNNAAKFTDPGGWITVRAERDGSHAVIRVRDSGRGLAPEALGRIFEPFAQAEPGDAARGGLGIGLALVRRLVALHGGEVSALSDGLGRGAEFVVKLPLGDGRGVEARAQAEAPAVQPGRAARVLVVDDNADIRETVKFILELDGHQVETAESGGRALERILAHPPDVVLLDLGLPDVDGCAVATEVRATLAARRPRLVAMTGSIAAGERARLVRSEFDAHLYKPIEARALATLLAGL
jgi:signal transduction histidine kinase